VKVVSVVGARPQFIKAAVTCRALQEAGLEQSVVHTGQHYERLMNDVFFSELGLPAPAHDLGVGSASHGAQTGQMMQRLELVLADESPDLVLVFGDTNSTLAGALVAAKLPVPIGHVEAGLRSHNRRMPEELNRIVADHLATLLFAPTETAVANLRREGVGDGCIRQVGDVMYDAALAYGPAAAATSTVLERHGLAPGSFILATVHRAENTDDPARLAAILDGLAGVSDDWPVVLPLHPRTRDALTALHASPPPELRVVDPLGYLDMTLLEMSAALIATDSGGVQKEAFFHRVPCVTLRDETEWVELVELGWNRLVPPLDADNVAAGIRSAVGTKGRDGEPYGAGDAAEKIVRAIERRG
jgi:UDP-GlcNAc3NAcA epimerase